MTDETSAPAGGEAIAVITPAADTGSDLSISQAARALQAARRPKEPAAESAPEATAEPELAQANAGSDENPAPGEEPEGNDPDAERLPPIDRPRSWSKDDDDDWNALPRARQEKIATNERAREADINRRINDAAEKLKGLTAKEQQTEQVRQQLEADVKAARDVLEREQRTKFPDIKSWDDYERLSAEASRLSEIDPFTSLRIANYLKDFDTHQKSMQFNAQQAKQIEDQKAQEKQGKRNAYEAEQNKLLIELVPEMADPKKANELRGRAVAMLTDDLGLKNDQLSRWMQDDTGHEILSNAGIQKLIADGLKYRDIQAAPKAVAAKPLPSVQRPGTSRPAGNANSERIQALTRQLNETGDLRIAQQLRALQTRRAS